MRSPDEDAPPYLANRKLTHLYIPPDVFKEERKPGQDSRPARRMHAASLAEEQQGRFWDDEDKRTRAPWERELGDTRILRELTKLGWFDPRTKAPRFPLAYCLFWCYSFTKGYAFEVEIFTNLKRSGVAFNAHDLFVREGRFSEFNPFILGFCGDIKTSTDVL